MGLENEVVSVSLSGKLFRAFKDQGNLSTLFWVDKRYGGLEVREWSDRFRDNGQANWYVTTYTLNYLLNWLKGKGVIKLECINHLWLLDFIAYESSGEEPSTTGVTPQEAVGRLVLWYLTGELVDGGLNRV